MRVVSPANHFLFTPMLPGSAVGSVEFRAIQEPVRTIPGLTRYYQAKAIQLDDETLGTVFFRGPQTEMEGIFFAKFPLAMLG